MIVRLVLAAVVAAALLGAAIPVIEDARHDVSATEAEQTAQQLAAAITQVSRSSDPVPPGVPGAKRVVTVDLPPDATVRVGGAPNESAVDGPGSDLVRYEVGPATSGRERVPVDTRVVVDGAVQPDSEGLVLRGSERVVVLYVLVDDEPTALVGRV